MRIRSLLVTLLLVPFGASCACTATDPVAVARDLYTGHHFFYTFESGDLALLSPKLAGLLKQDWHCQEPGDQCAIGADPWINAQDGDALEPIEYVLLTSDATTATVEMKYRLGWAEIANEATPQTTRLQLVRSDAAGCWLLDDLRVGTVSLQAILADYEY